MYKHLRPEPPVQCTITTTMTIPTAIYHNYKHRYHTCTTNKYKCGGTRFTPRTGRRLRAGSTLKTSITIRLAPIIGSSAKAWPQRSTCVPAGPHGGCSRTGARSNWPAQCFAKLRSLAAPCTQMCTVSTSHQYN